MTGIYDVKTVIKTERLARCKTCVFFTKRNHTGNCNPWGECLNENADIVHLLPANEEGPPVVHQYQIACCFYANNHTEN